MIETIRTGFEDIVLEDERIDSFEEGTAVGEPCTAIAYISPANAANMCSAIEVISNADGEAGDLTFHLEAALLGVGVHIILVDAENDRAGEVGPDRDPEGPQVFLTYRSLAEDSLGEHRLENRR